MPLPAFRWIVRGEGGGRYAKGFPSHAIRRHALPQLAQAKSLTEIRNGLHLTCGKLNHLGITQAPAKSSLAYANKHCGKIYD